MNTVIFDEIPEGWDKFVKNITNPSFIYTKVYLNFLRKSGYTLEIITVMDDKKIVSALPIILFKKLGFKAFFYIPLVGYDSVIHLPNVNKTKQILEEFVKMSREKNIVFSKLCDMSSVLKKHKKFLTSNGFEYGKEGVYIIDIKPLEEPLEYIWNNVFDQELRNSIKKARKFLKIKEIKNVKEMEELYQSFVDTSKRHKEKPQPMSRYVEIFNLPKNRVKWYIVEFNGKYIATGISWVYGDEIIYSISASLDEYKNYPGSDLLLWELIRFAIENKYKKINISGVPEDNVGLQEYKEKWKPRLVDCDVYIYKSPLYKISGKMKIFKKFLSVA